MTITTIRCPECGKLVEVISGRSLSWHERTKIVRITNDLKHDWPDPQNMLSFNCLDNGEIE